MVGCDHTLYVRTKLKGTVKIYGKHMQFAQGQQFATRLGLLLCEHPFETAFGVQCEVTGKKHPDNDGSGGTEVMSWPPWHKTKAMEKAGVESVNLIKIDAPVIESIEPLEIQF